MKIEKRILDFEQMGMGMFIHYGLFSLVGRGEKSPAFLHTMPWNEYCALPEKFSAEHFDAHQIARMAKQAGIKYIVLTSRHHDGFSLYDTCGLNTYDAPHSLAGRDLIREFVDACNEEGIVPFLYHTTIDWHEDSYKTNFPEYQKYLRQSVEVICTKYGTLGGLWFDGNWDRPDADWEEQALYGMVRHYQPDAIIINNSGMGSLGKAGSEELDSVTFEQHRASPLDRSAMTKYLAAERCLTMNEHWGYSSRDFAYKSSASLIEDLCASRKVGANLLLNIGPKGDGSVPLIQQGILEEIGNWMRIFGQAIYDGRPVGIEGKGKNFGLVGKGGTLYLFFHDINMEGAWNEYMDAEKPGFGPQTFTGLPQVIDGIVWMDDGSKAKFTQDVDAHTVTVDCPKYPYGDNFVVRVAKCTMKS